MASKPLIPLRTVAAAAALNERGMPSMCQVRAVTDATTTDSLGEVVPTTAPWSEPIQCRFVPLSSEEQQRAEAWVAGGTALLSLPVGTVIGLSDQVLITNDAYDVAGLEPPTPHSTAVRVSLTPTPPITL